jgi:excisionase family DNA binding protein
MNPTTPGSGTGRPERAGTAAKPICRRLFDLEQAANFAGVSVQVICRWIRMGKLEAYHLGGGRVRIDEVELADLISSADSERSSRRGSKDGSSPRFASAETSRR